MKFNKLAFSVVASSMLVGMMGMGVNAQTVSKHVSALAVEYPTVLLLTVYHGPQNGVMHNPNFTPAYFSAPANSRVELIIHNYDDGPSPVMGDNYKVKGTVGGYEIAEGKKVTALDKNNVAHTLTIPSLNLNIPIPPKLTNEPYSTVTAYFNTGKAGTYKWDCLAACGTGTGGWAGVMSPALGQGWMYGTFTVYNLKNYQK